MGVCVRDRRRRDRQTERERKRRVGEAKRVKIIRQNQKVRKKFIEDYGKEILGKRA